MDESRNRMSPARMPASGAPRATQQGAVMVATLMLSLVVMLGLAAAVMKATTLARSSRFSLDRLEAQALAESVTEAALGRLLSQAANTGHPEMQGAIEIGSVSYPYTVFEVGEESQRTDADGVVHVIRPYEVRATVDVGDGSATVRRTVLLKSTPIFQYMIFYQDDLEILPGPSMTIGGRVHTNGSIYVGTGSTLTVNTDQFDAAGGIYRERKDTGETTGGTVDIKVLGESSYAALDPQYDSRYPDWLDHSSTLWKGSVRSGAHGVGSVSVPEVGMILAFDPDTGEKGFYHGQAGLVVRDDQVLTSTGTVIDTLTGVVTNERTLYDAREGKYVEVTDIDVAALGASGQFPSNGLLYAYRTDSTAAEPHGIRLVNGQQLAAPLTVVTEDPLYIKGDFNTVEKKGAAVIADAVNLLSNAWDDSKTAGSLPSATATTYNVAIITGNVPTPEAGGDYSGGFENLLRLHENWSGVTATLRGSFIKIFESRIARSRWQSGGSFYLPPVRDWRFDTSLLQAAHHPPVTPRAVHLERVWWDDGVPSRLVSTGAGL